MFFQWHMVGMVCVSLSVVFVAFTPSFKDTTNGEYPVLFFALYTINRSLLYVVGSIEWLAVTAVYTRVADPLIGGTYMTLLATIDNLGWMYPNTILLYLIGFFTVKACKVSDALLNETTVLTNSLNETVLGFIESNKCSTSTLIEASFK
jgi:hypothetical protein